MYIQNISMEFLLSMLNTFYNMTVDCEIISFISISASVTAAINYYRCAFQYPAKYFKEPIKVPVLSIFGTADKYLSVAAAEGTQKYVKTLKQEFLDGIGHWVQMEDPDKVNRIMRDYLLE